MAQPALGMQIKLLEDELGVSLLLRHSRGVAATPAGKLMYRHALRILDSIELARHEVQELRANKPPTLRLGVNPSFVQVIGPNLLTDAQKVLPDTKVSLTEERSHSLVNALERRQLDLALVYNIEDHPDFLREALIEEDLLFLTSAGSTRQRSAIQFAQVLKTNLAIGGELSIVRQILEAEARRLSLAVRPGYEVHSLTSMISVVRRGKATTVMPYALCMKDIKKGTAIGRRIISPNLTRTLYLVQQRTHLPVLDDERIRKFIFVLLRSYCSSIAPHARWISDHGS